MSVLETILHGLGAFLIVGGSVFCVIGGIGIVRLPEFYSRCHGAGITDSAGAAGVLLGLALFTNPIGAIKLVLVLAFVWLSSAVSTHALAKAAFSQGVRLDDIPRVDWTLPPPSPEALEEDLAARVAQAAAIATDPGTGVVTKAAEAGAEDKPSDDEEPES